MSAAAQEDAAATLRAFQDAWLAPARVAPPTVAPGPIAAYDGTLTGTAELVRPEDAAWNTWHGGGARLFNNAAALVFDVEVRGAGELRWVPEDTRVDVNVRGDGLVAAPQPDDLLVPLLQAALVQERAVLDGDLTARARAAGPFRGAYLPLAEEERALDGLIAFPLEDPDAQIVALELQVTVDVDGVPHALTWSFD